MLFAVLAWAQMCIGDGVVPIKNGRLDTPLNANNKPITNLYDGTFTGTAATVNYVRNYVELPYPVLKIELGGEWTDFELKASINNFDPGTDVVYYIRSWEQTACPFDKNVWIYFQDDGSANPWEWKRSLYATSILSQLQDQANTEVESVMVFPSHQCEFDAYVWMYPTNKNLTWSYVRYNGMTFEMNNAGKIHHVITEPIKWVKERTDY